MNVKKRIVLLSSGAIVANALYFFSTPLLSRIYTPADFASANLFALALGLISVICTWRFEHLILPEPNQIRKTQVFRITLALGAIFASATSPLLVIWGTEAATLLGDTRLASTMPLIPLGAFLFCASAALQSAAQAEGKIKECALSDVINKAALTLTGCLAWHILPGATALIVAPCVGYGSKCLYLISVISRQRPLFRPYLTKHTWITIYRRAHAKLPMSTGLVFSFMIYSATNATPAIFIGHNFGMDALGQYTLAYTMTSVGEIAVGGSVGRIYYQQASEAKTKGEDVSHIWLKYATRLFAFGIPVYIIGICISPVGIPIIFGDQWNEAGVYAIPIGIAALFSFLTSPLGWTFAIMGKSWYAPTWHALRFIAIVLYCAVSTIIQQETLTFIIGISIISITMFVVDFIAQCKFAKSK